MGWRTGGWRSAGSYKAAMSGRTAGATQVYDPNVPYIQQQREGGGPSAPPPAKNPPVKKP